MNLTDRERELILFIRQLGWGDLKIRVENGQPVLVYEAIRTFKLGESQKKNLVRATAGNHPTQD